MVLDFQVTHGFLDLSMDNLIGKKLHVGANLGYASMVDWLGFFYST